MKFHTRALLIAAALASSACISRTDRLTFQVKVSDLRRPANSLVKGKSADDTIELTLPGALLRPPVVLPIVERRDANWSTPEHAAAAIVSANLRGDVSWMIDSYAPTERSEHSDPAFAQRTSDFYRNLGKIQMTGWANVRSFNVVFLLGQEEDGDATVATLTLVNTDSGWRQTNALAEDDTFEVIWTALHTGGVR